MGVTDRGAGVVGQLRTVERLQAQREAGHGRVQLAVGELLGVEHVLGDLVAPGGADRL